MSKTIIYTYNEKDFNKVVYRAVELIMRKTGQTELINSSMLQDDEKLTQTGASNLLGVSVATIIAWRKSGKIPRDAYIRLGKPIFYSKKKLLEYAKKDRGLVKSA